MYNVVDHLFGCLVFKFEVSALVIETRLFIRFKCPTTRVVGRVFCLAGD